MTSIYLTLQTLVDILSKFKSRNIFTNRILFSSMFNKFSSSFSLKLNMNLLIVLIFIHFPLSYTRENNSYHYALTLRRRYNLETQKYEHSLPDGGIRIANETHFAQNNEHEIYLCPVQSKNDENLVEIIENSQYCLLIEEFTRGAPKICIKEPEPVVKRSSEEGKPLQCGKEIPNRPMDSKYPPRAKVNEIIPDIPQNRLLYSFLYMGCGSRRSIYEWLQKPDRENHSIIDAVDTPIYNFCYDDETKSTIYVEYSLKPKNFIIQGIDDELQYDSNKYNTAPFLFKNSLFSQQLDAYNNQKESSPHMVPYYLVPKDHMSFGLWKKTTQYMLNTAPLWDELIPLIKFIDARLKYLAIQEQKTLQIYTTAYYHQFDHIKPAYLDKDEKFLIPNIWCKVIVYPGERNDLAIAIIIQNTPNIQPKVPICDKVLECGFSFWPYSSTPDILTKYAYCCKVTKLVQDLFPISLPRLEAVFELAYTYTKPARRLSEAEKM